MVGMEGRSEKALICKICLLTKVHLKYKACALYMCDTN